MGTDRHTHSQPSLYPIHHPSPQTNMKTLLLSVIPMVIFAMVDAQYGRGGCDWRECRNNRYLAQRCCDSSGTCCDFADGGGNYGGGYNNNNKPGNCPPYDGRKKRSPRGRFPVTTATTMEAKATTLVTTMAATTATTEGAVSETAIVPLTSSAVISGLATSAPAH